MQIDLYCRWCHWLLAHFFHLEFKIEWPKWAIVFHADIYLLCRNRNSVVLCVFSTQSTVYTFHLSCTEYLLFLAVASGVRHCHKQKLFLSEKSKIRKNVFPPRKWTGSSHTIQALIIIIITWTLNAELKIISISMNQILNRKRQQKGVRGETTTVDSRHRRFVNKLFKRNPQPFWGLRSTVCEYLLFIDFSEF